MWIAVRTSRGVVEMLLDGLPDGFDAHFLKGNHEALLLDFIDVPRAARGIGG